jgi:hypothetical protein
MVYMASLGIIVIYGGRNDCLNECFLDDIQILYVESLIWAVVVVQGIPRAPRSGHSAVVLDKKLVIFGGYNRDGFVSSDIQLLELETYVVNKLNEKEKKLEKEIQNVEIINSKKKKSGTIVQKVNVEDEKQKFLEKIEIEKKVIVFDHIIYRSQLTSESKWKNCNLRI